MPLRTSRDDGSLITPCERRRVPLHGQFSGVAARELAVLDGDQLRQDADGNLLWRDSADVEADGCVYPLEPLDRDALGVQRIVYSGDLRAAADETEVPHVLFRQRAKRLEIVGMTARHDDDI